MLSVTLGQLNQPIYTLLNVMDFKIVIYVQREKFEIKLSSRWVPSLVLSLARNILRRLPCCEPVELPRATTRSSPFGIVGPSYLSYPSVSLSTRAAYSCVLVHLKILVSSFST